MNASWNWVDFSGSVQNAAARLIFNVRRCHHITDALISLHWLRVPERITFNVATLTYHALHGTSPPYLASSFTCVADMPHRRRLRSASTEQLDVPTYRRSTVGGRAFPVAGAKVWNGLPSDVTSASSLSVFKNRLKTYLFRRCYETVWLSITFLFPSHHLPPQNSGPCKSFYCLGHFKNVYDDDDDEFRPLQFVITVNAASQNNRDVGAFVHSYCLCREIPPHVYRGVSNVAVITAHLQCKSSRIALAS